MFLTSLFIIYRDMTTSSTHKKYPARLYEEGKCPLQYRSMNHNCKANCCGFEGLSDQCIPAMCIKLAAEIYDEVLGL